METSLHRQLKELYAEGDARIEVPLDGYRIDVLSGDELIEIQHASLAALRPKVRRLLDAHWVRIVKPLVAAKVLVKQDARGGRVVSRRASPKRCGLLNLFDELIYFADVFPHRRLTLEFVLVEVEEWRYPGHGRRRRWRANDFEVEDQRLSAVRNRLTLRTAADLRKLLPARLPRQFHTGDLAERLEISRSLAQRMAYCLRHAGTVEVAGKSGNALLYRCLPRRRAA